LCDGQVTVTGDLLSTVTANIDDRWARAIGDHGDRDRGVRSGMVKASGVDRWVTVTGGALSAVHVSKTVICSVLPLLMCDDDRWPAASGVLWCHGQVTVTGDALSTVTANIDDRWARAIGDRDNRDRGVRSGMVKASGVDRSVTTMVTGDDDRSPVAMRTRGPMPMAMVIEDVQLTTETGDVDRWRAAKMTGGAVLPVMVPRVRREGVLRRG